MTFIKINIWSRFLVWKRLGGKINWPRKTARFLQRKPVFTCGLVLYAQVNILAALQVWEGRWRVIPFHVLPDWLKDNDYLLHGHRPPMPSFRACFGSIFRIHTETGNIWTHLLGEHENSYTVSHVFDAELYEDPKDFFPSSGWILFVCLGTLTMLRPNMYFMAPLQEKVVFGMFFLGAVLCLSFSWLFHTVYCHSEKVSRTFSK